MDPIALAGTGFASSLVTGIFTFYATKKKLAIDDRAQLSADIKEHIARLESRMAVLDAKIEMLETKNAVLVEENIQLRVKVASLEARNKARGDQ